VINAIYFFNYSNKDVSGMLCPECGKMIDGSHGAVCPCGYEFNIPVEKTALIEEGDILSKIEDDFVSEPTNKRSSLQAGDIVAKCKLGSVLGSGGMGKVYKAQHTALDIPVALKVLSPKYSYKKDYVQRFYREAQVAAKINHQNIVRVYDCGCEGHILYIVMEFVGGGDLASVLEKNGPFSSSHAIDVALAICSALAEAEKFSIIHRDIKPENIMVSTDGNYKLADLGLAKQIDASSKEDLSLTVENVCMGSPLYISPEQSIDAKSCDIRSDIYSLGCTLFHILCGHSPYDGENWQEVVCKHMTSSVPSVKSQCPEVPHNLDRIIFKCMQKRPSERYQTAAELLEVIQSLRVVNTRSTASGTFSRTGISDSNLIPDILQTPYRTETKVHSTAYDSTHNDLICSSCGKECASRSTLKYVCTELNCNKRICIDCWMRNGSRKCSEHSCD